MKKILLLLILAATVLAACGEASKSTQQLIKLPSPPQGWMSVGSISAQSPGFTGFNASTGKVETAVEAACSGAGTLVVLLGQDGSSATVAETVVVPCSPGDVSKVTFTRVSVPTPEVSSLTVKAGVIEAAGASSPSSFAVSLEQMNP